MLIIKNAACYTPDQVIERAAIIIHESQIQAVETDGDVALPRDAQVIDASGLIAVPGFIDLQLNGGFGHDFTADPSTIWPVSGRLPRYGVTAYLPTIVTSPLATIQEAQRVLLQDRPSNFAGAEPLGLHLEGPFFNPARKGAHNPDYIRLPDEAFIKNWSAASGVSMVTLAPELPGATALIESLASRGVLVSAGHSLATYDEARAGFSAGIRCATHLFNAMPALGHRQPGLPGAVLDTEKICAGLIVDGLHVHPALVRQVWRAKGPDLLNLVSDATAALGMPPGRYRLNDREVIVGENDCRLADGILAGTNLALDQALRNLVACTGCSLSDGLATITSTPARLLGIDRERGRIAAGLIADLVLLTPDLQVAMTIGNGRILYQSEDFSSNLPSR